MGDVKTVNGIKGGTRADFGLWNRQNSGNFLDGLGGRSLATVHQVIVQYMSGL